ncbi:MAG: hypothetical protein B7X59_05865 [Polaromonas sp. 39-63-203]|uniref:hypothetical protein n=1 Tax=Polaromonas sp. TaxID=1869339 RepID=UPI000BCC704C|nr:hypothetical protein [Polaromonas sp.]OYY52668.1 MAG: hypothetical protein B7Y54_06075 [Polaromonas sp. 35-63-240]OYZ83897.1 MAG: hypothetical protein B7Y03_06745 [Polaromonas sp. 24-62-144]OZA98523.1 MAG: hypothetical protein B7X59_05865 [Polaromonas sp. 39-63-203]HQS32746.1 hypothetical protein [Polaromonas sp.]HQS91929.1 hypothetical protein [Polaromonas sp.]
MSDPAPRTLEQDLEALLAAMPDTPPPTDQSYAEWREQQLDRDEQEFNRMCSLSARELTAELDLRDDLTFREIVLLDKLIRVIEIADDLATTAA